MEEWQWVIGIIWEKKKGGEEIRHREKGRGTKMYWRLTGIFKVVEGVLTENNYDLFVKHFTG